MEACCSRFTAAEGGARLAAAVGNTNILTVEYGSFIATRLVYEEAYKIRGPLYEEYQRTIYVTRASRVPFVTYELKILTDLSIAHGVNYNDAYDWCSELDSNQVLVCTSSLIKQILDEGILSMTKINVLILDSCHLVSKDENLQHVMKLYKECEESNRPRILALTYPLFTLTKKDIESLKTNIGNTSEDARHNDNSSKNEEESTTLTGGENDKNDGDCLNVVVETEISQKPNVIMKEVKDDNIEIIKSEKGEEPTNIDHDDEASSVESLSKTESSKSIKEKIYEKNEKREIGGYENIDDFEMYEKIEWKIEELEKALCCHMDLVEDIDGGKRLSPSTTKPKELIVEYGKRPSDDELPEEYIQLDKFMRDTVQEAMKFLDDHRYDPMEIYGEDLYEEFVNIPNPTIDPKYIFQQFTYILDQLGPYGADKAAFTLLIKLEKLKIKVPYERHFLLLCLCTTVFVKIRCHAENVFSKYESDLEKINKFSTPKVLRFAEILEKFQPPDAENIKNVDDSKNSHDLGGNGNVSCSEFTNNDRLSKKFESEEQNLELETDKAINIEDSKTSENKHLKSSDNITDTVKLLTEIDNCDFVTLANKIEDRVNTYVANLKDLADDNDFIEGKENHTVENKLDIDMSECSESDVNKNHKNDNTIENEEKSENTNKENDSKTLQKNEIDNKEGVQPVFGFSKRVHRIRGRGRVQRNNTTRIQQMQLNPDALCGIVFMKEPLMAKIMFMIVVDLSRANHKLSYLCAQYCALEPPADPSAEPREFQRQGKKQEEVLKKFRMHECNLLLATPALEEGIDLPRCNFVLRWDAPASYRSYGVCRGRARAARAACVLMSEADPESTRTLLHNLATYKELDQIITRKCGCGIQNEPPPAEEDNADNYTTVIKPYTPFGTSAKKIINHSENDKVSTESRNNSCELDKYEMKSHEANVNSKVKENVENSETHKALADSRINNSSELDKSEMKSFEANVKSKVINNEHNRGSNKDRENIEENTVSDISFDGTIDEIGVSQIDINNCLMSQENIITDKVQSENMNYDKGIINNLTCNKCNTERLDATAECPCDNNTAKVLRDFKSVSSEYCNYQTTTNCRKNEGVGAASVDLSTAIALINRYCGKLPSDTFTRLAPQWWMEEVQLPTREGDLRTAYICTLRLPLNCPVKYNIVGHPMPTKALARRIVALQACRILHKSGELDNQLMPIGKENFKAAELDAGVCLNVQEAEDHSEMARPGTTKRRQYYYKRTARAFTDCQPIIDTADSDIYQPVTSDRHTNNSEDKVTSKSTVEVKEILINKGTKVNILYSIISSLCCALPERYNTRGRRLHAPQNATQALGILMATDQPDSLQPPAFPVYTRSGEVRVTVQRAPHADVRLSPRRARTVRRFMRFVFSEVLRVRRKGMKLQNDGSAHNNYYIVPTIKLRRPDGTTLIDIDWPFLELIYQHTETKKHCELEKRIVWHREEHEELEEEEEDEEKAAAKREGEKKVENPLLKPGEVFVFDAEKYMEAVVTPWYRNRDQPQFFLVAEICWNLTPDSEFPSAIHTSFRNYYSSKYGVELTQSNQPLLDVDHTSARLNLLTPRYVNRKGVALPVSSERTRRAKRDRLDQKQILVPELCRVHPFAAPLWFATVALPCVLYRINALLIADEIRRAVAIDVGLGIPKIDETTCPGFSWPPLDFGWSLSEVLNADVEKNEKKKEEEVDDKITQNISNTESADVSKEGDAELAPDDNQQGEAREKTINEILEEKEAESAFEIGTWSNDMASSIPDADELDEYLQPLPPNLTFCTSASGGSNWCDPIVKPKSQFNPTEAFSMADSDCSYMSSDLDTDDTDMDSDSSDVETDPSGFSTSRNTNAAMGVRIEYKTAHEAEAVDVERKRKVNPAPRADERDDTLDRLEHDAFVRAGDAPHEYIKKFRECVAKNKAEVIERGDVIKRDEKINQILPETSKELREDKLSRTSSDVRDVIEKMSKMNIDKSDLIDELFPYGDGALDFNADGQISLESIEKNKRLLLDELKRNLSANEIERLNCFSMVDVDIDSSSYVNEKVVNVGFDAKSKYQEKVEKWDVASEFEPHHENKKNGFNFDYQPKLEGHPGPSPSVILQALTMSNANDGINLERLETIGDSFLKFAITAYLYCAHPTVHEGKLSHMRSKQVSNLNLYRLGRNKRLGSRMIASKFEPHDNWLPPCHKPPPTLHPNTTDAEGGETQDAPVDSSGCFIPYNLITQHSIPDKSIADCVEALIGAYLLECGPRGALLFMSWLGIRVLPKHLIPLSEHHPYVVAAERSERIEKPQQSRTKKVIHNNPEDSETECSSNDEAEHWQEEQEEYHEDDWSWPGRTVGSLRPYRDENRRWVQAVFGELKAPPSPLLRYIKDPEGELEQMLSGYDALERTLQYRFQDRSLLLQALTHASHTKNRLTDCYQRLEFLGDAILDYLITRHLYEDARRHSPGALTDLRSALVNNTIFATLAVRHGFHKYFRHMSPGLNEVLTKYVRIQEENGHSISEEHYLIHEDEMEQAEDVEVPKALGDLFESVAGAIFLDSGMSLDAVWKSYVNLMGAELEAFSAAAPKSPVRELLEAEPDTAKFGKPERLADGRRVRVCVEVFGRGTFKGIGRNYRIAKGTAARCALRHLRLHRPR